MSINPCGNSQIPQVVVNVAKTNVIVRSIKVQRPADLPRGPLRARHVSQDAGVTVAAGVGRGGAGGFVEIPVPNQPSVGLGSKKQQRRRQEKAPQK